MSSYPTNMHGKLSFSCLQFALGGGNPQRAHPSTMLSDPSMRSFFPFVFNSSLMLGKNDPTLIG